MALTDLHGYLEPCGCQSRPLGGIEKLAAKLLALRASGVPTIFVAVGDVFFEASQGDLNAARTQEVWKAESVAKILGELKVDALTPGQGDLLYGLQTFESLTLKHGLPVLAAGVSVDRGEGAAEFTGGRLLEVGKTKVGIFGLSDLPASEGLRVNGDLKAQAQRLTTQLRSQGARLVIGLIRSDRRTARRIAGAVRGLDFLVLGGIDVEQAAPPGRLGDTNLLAAGRNGQGVTVVDVFIRGDGPFADESEWTTQLRRKDMQRRIRALGKRIAAWESQSDVNPDDLAAQRQRRDRLEKELATLAWASPGQGNGYSAHWVEFAPDAAVDEATAALVDAHDKRVNEHNRQAFASLAPLAVPKGAASYLGSAACAECHEEAFDWWTKHPHGKAYGTLEERHKQFNLSCVGCHVTGYDQPGGARIVQNEGLTGVGCESCHGPGSFHADDPDTDQPTVHLEVLESECTQCHNAEHSDKFNYDKYKEGLMAPGHGEPAKG